MSGLADFMLSDDDGHLLRSILRRLDYLEAALLNDIRTGMTIPYPGPLRSAKWSEDRATSVGNNYTRWYQLNEVNETHTFNDIGGSVPNQLALAGSVWPVQGQPGGMASQGSYSIDTPGPTGVLQAPYVPTGARDWSIEAIFMADTLPQSDAVVLKNGTSYGFNISGAAGGSGSRLTAWIGGVGYVDMGAINAKQWYAAIAISDSTDNTIKWFLGTLAFPAMAWSLTSGSVAMGAPAAPSGVMTLAGFDGRLDEALIYNGKIPTGTARLSAEDRIRTALQPAAPSGFAPADGIAVARQKYANLFNKVGTLHGAGDGSTTFNLPNIPGGIVKL